MYEDGILTDANEALIEEIYSLKTFQYLELFVKINEPVRKTIDCFTFGGVVKLYGPVLADVIADYERIKEIERNGLFNIQ